MTGSLVFVPAVYARGDARGDDEMVEFAPHMAVERKAGLRLGVIGRGTVTTVAPSADLADPDPSPTATVSVVSPKARVKSARALLALGAGVADVATSVGLTVAEVREIRAAMRGGR